MKQLWKDHPALVIIFVVLVIGVVIGLVLLVVHFIRRKEIENKTENLPLVHLDKVSTDKKNFDNKVRDYAAQLGTNPNYLMETMNQESGMNPAAVNPVSGASGLIGFLPDTAIHLGTTVEQLRVMPATKQLDYVYQYFKPYAGKMPKFEDVRMADVYPAALGEKKTFQLPGWITQFNPQFDLNKNGRISVGELKNYFSSKAKANVPKEYQTLFN